MCYILVAPPTGPVGKHLVAKATFAGLSEVTSVDMDV
jgi:hypothetical protein